MIQRRSCAALAFWLGACVLNGQTTARTGALTAAVTANAKVAPPAGNQKDAVEQIVRDYIMEHPELLMESLQRFQQNAKTAEAQRNREMVVARQADLTKDALTPVAGNPKSQVTLTAFFDYRCGFCKKVMADLLPLTKPDSPVRVVFKEFPILGPESTTATRAALAAAKQGAYLEFHKALMSTPEAISMETLEAVAGRLKLDVAKWKADMAAPELEQTIQANHELAASIGVQATPTFVAGSELVAGAMDAAGFRALIERAKGQPKAAVGK